MRIKPENTTRKIDALGRITIPKGLRDRMGLHENDDMELFTMESGGKEYICLTAAKEDVDRYKLAVELLQELNIGIPAELATKVGLRD
jgi:AbrB family looped-hinge helix DNA binding protein